MTETFLVIVAVIGVFTVVARRIAMPGRNFPQPIDSPVELPQPGVSEGESDGPSLDKQE